MATQAEIIQLQRAISNQVAVFGQKSESVYQAIPSIKINSMNPVFPFWNDMTAYHDEGNSGIGGDLTQTLGDGIEYKSGFVYQHLLERTIPIQLKRAASVIEDPKGVILVNHVAKAIADSLFVKQERNFKNAVDGVTFTNGLNVFNAGNIHSDTAAKDFRSSVNLAIYHLESEMQGVSDGRKVMMFMNKKAYATLTGSQKLTNFFNGYAERNSNFNIQTIEAIFSQNAQMEVNLIVAGMRYLPQGFSQGQTAPIWGEDNSIYIFMASNDPFGDRTAIKRLEGISEMRTWEEGLNTKFQAYVDFGYMFDVETAFARVDFVTA